MRDNRHMNLFEHYKQKDAIPHENNVSRALAILLDVEPLLLDRFIDLVNGKLQELKSGLVSKPSDREDWEICFQQSASSLAENDVTPSRIVMGNVYRLQGESKHSILGHYLKYLESIVPSALPARGF